MCCSVLTLFDRSFFSTLFALRFDLVMCDMCCSCNPCSVHFQQWNSSSLDPDQVSVSPHTGPFRYQTDSWDALSAMQSQLESVPVRPQTKVCVCDVMKKMTDTQRRMVKHPNWANRSLSHRAMLISMVRCGTAPLGNCDWCVTHAACD